MTQLTIIVSLLVLAPFMAGATGAYECEPTERDSWITKEELITGLEESGWSIRFVKEDGGCWEVYGQDSEGRRVEGYFHPVTGETQFVSQRGKVLFRKED